MSIKRESKPKKIGRPLDLEVDEKTLAQVWELGRIQATTLEASAVLGVAENMFLAFLEREPTAEETFERGKAFGRASLRRIQFKLAETNAAMAILLGKMYLGQTDKSAPENTQASLLVEAEKWLERNIAALKNDELDALISQHKAQVPNLQSVATQSGDDENAV